MSQSRNNTKPQSSRNNRKRFLRVELLETRSLLAGDVFGCMEDQFDSLDLNSSSLTCPISEPAELADEQASFETWLMKVAVFEEEPEPEGEPSAGAQAEAEPIATGVQQGPTLPSLIQFVQRNDSQLLEPPATSPAPGESQVPSSQLDTQNPSTVRPAEQQQPATSPNQSAADVVLSIGLTSASSTGSLLSTNLANNEFAGGFNSLSTNSLLSNQGSVGSSLLDILSSSSRRHGEQRELESLLSDLAEEHFKTGFHDLLSESVADETRASERILVDHNAPVEIREAFIDVQQPTGEILDGLMAMEIPQDLLPNNAELLERGKEGVWAVPLGVYRQGEVALGNAALAQASDAMNTARSKESEREVENTGQLIIAYLRPVAAATSVAFGAIFIGFKRQADRDDEVRKQFEQLR